MRSILIIFLLLTASLGSQISAQNLSDTQVEAFAKLGKVWGFLKYYHPQVTKGNYDWDGILLHEIPRFQRLRTEEEINKELYSWIKSLSKAKGVSNYEANGDVILKPDVEWIHHEETLGKEVTELLYTIWNSTRNVESEYISMLEGVEFTNELDHLGFDFKDKGLLLLSLFRYWNIIEYYYPYRDKVNHWDQVLKTYIPKFWEVSNSLEYKLTFQELAAETNDSHSLVFDEELDQYYGLNLPAIDVRQVEGKAVVYRLLPGFNHGKLKQGDVIVEYGGKSLLDKAKELKKYVAGSNQTVRENRSLLLAMRTNDLSVKVKLENDSSMEVPVYNFHNASVIWQKKDASTLLAGNIGYIYLGSMKKGEVQASFDKFKESKGLILDLRCYPSEDIYEEVLSQVSDKPLEFIKFSQGSITNPGMFSLDPITGKVMPNPQYYDKKIVVLVDYLTLSQTETIAMAFEANPNVTVIGSTTAGANGDVVGITLPGNVFTQITGTGTYYPDGSEIQGIGIIPDIEIRPSIEALLKSRDPSLDKAIEIILAK